MENIKSLFAEYEELEAKSDAFDEAWAADPESEELEAAWDEAYRVMWNKGEELAAAISGFTAGAIDVRLARRMLTIKRDELRDLIARAA